MSRIDEIRKQYLDRSDCKMAIAYLESHPFEHKEGSSRRTICHVCSQKHYDKFIEQADGHCAYSLYRELICALRPRDEHIVILRGTGGSGPTTLLLYKLEEGGEMVQMSPELMEALLPTTVPWTCIRCKKGGTKVDLFDIDMCYTCAETARHRSRKK